MKSAEKQYLDAFGDELSGFKGRVEQRAKVRIEEATRAYEEEERQKRLGPGGLDPVEVMETLPHELKECFETKSVAMLQEVIAKLPKEEATYHMQRCIDSGLWVPDAKAAGVCVCGGGGGGGGGWVWVCGCGCVWVGVCVWVCLCMCLSVCLCACLSVCLSLSVWIFIVCINCLTSIP